MENHPFSTEADLGTETDLKLLPAVVGERLSEMAFSQLAGNLGGHPFVKIVIDRSGPTIHFLNHAVFQFHSDYIGTQILGVSQEEVDREIDSYNQSFYHDPERRFILGVLALHKRDDRRFFSLETVEVDTMKLDLLRTMYQIVRDAIDPSFALLIKPANYLQESFLANVPLAELPRIHSHELFATSKYICLHPGVTEGRIRAFANEKAYRDQRSSLAWYDIIVMPKVPDDIPRLSGIINAEHTTPLSHTNVLASGWAVPNCTQIGILDRIQAEELDGKWVRYVAKNELEQVSLTPIAAPEKAASTPPWQVNQIKLEEPEVQNMPILPLEELRMSNRNRYGTKAANLGELNYVLTRGSERLTGFYRVRRPPRENLLPYLAALLEAPPNENMSRASWHFLRRFVHLPRGIAIPFSLQQAFFESSPKIQQAIGKLKMALELNARQVDSLCVQLQGMILAARFPDAIRDEIDAKISEHLAGVSSFVVRSSSNAEDLENFSAAGIYESVNHVSTSSKILESVKRVWSSVLSPRSVKLRHEMGISLDDVYMGVIIQEEVTSSMGGVMVTTNPANRADFRNVYLNVSKKSVNQVVQGTSLPIQCLMNTVEGGGRTIAKGSANEDLTEKEKENLQKLSVAGRLLQSHFSASYTFADPIDVEWLCNNDQIYVLQLRPFSS